MRALFEDYNTRVDVAVTHTSSDGKGAGVHAAEE